MPDTTRRDAAVPPPAVLRFGRCEVRCDTREVFLDGQPQPVRRRVFDLIVYLVQQGPRAVTHQELLVKVWQRKQASSSLLARAVMEARRAVGDDADDVSLIVSVHGVGYRFAGTVAAAATAVPDPGRTDAATAPAEPADPVVQEGAAVRDLVLRARQAVFERRYEAARQLADQAMARADALGSHAEKVRAMLVRGSVALQVDRAPEAARLFADALRMARAEGHAALIAEARLYAGGLHVVAGDPELAIQHLRAAMAVYTQPGHEGDLIRCLNWLSQALRRQGELEAGLQACRRSIELGGRQGGPNFAILDRVNEVRFLVALGDRDAAMGRADLARAHYETGLAHNEAVLRDLQAIDNRSVWLTALGNHALLLERADQLQQAWQVMQQVQDETAALPPDRAHMGQGNQPLMLMQWARLLARSGRIEEALAHVRQAIEQATGGEQHARELDDLYRQAADIAEQAGDLGAALRWQRACSAELVRMHRGKAASLAAVLAAEMNTDELQAQLEGALKRQQELQQQTAELQRRLQRLEGTLPVCPHSGLADAAMLEAAFAPAHALARARELPMCVGLLSLQNAGELQGLHGAQAVAGLWKQVGEMAGNFGDVALPAVDMGSGRVAFRVCDAGPTRARALGQELVAHLQRRFGRDPGLAVAPRWQWACADAAQEPSVQACVERLLAGAAA